MTVVQDVSGETLLEMYITMLRIRRFEERVAELLLDHEIKCPTHLYTGQEAIAAGVCANLRKDDYVFSTHRSHGHYIAKGGGLKALMAELYGRVTGCSRGRGGSMHLVDPEIGLLGSAAIVSGTIPMSVGAALSSVIAGNDCVSVAFFGDGATDEGVFDESLNFAALMKLPVVFICENNLFSTHLPLYLRQPADNILERAQSHRLPGWQVDGNNVMEVFNVSREAVANARSGKGPSFIECRTFRWRSHVGPWRDLDVGLRKKADVEAWMDRCPIKAHEALLMEQGLLSETEKDRYYRQVDAEVADSLVFAQESPFPDESSLNEGAFKT